MALRAKIVDLVRLRGLQDPGQTRAVGEIAVVQDKAAVPDAGILVEVIDPVGVEKRRASLDAVRHVALREEQFGEVSTDLSGNACDEGDFRRCGHRQQLEVDVRLFSTGLPIHLCVGAT